MIVPMVYHHMIVFIRSYQLADHHIVKGCINNKQYPSRDLSQKEIVHIKHSSVPGIVFHNPPTTPPLSLSTRSVTACDETEKGGLDDFKMMLQ